MRWLVPCLAFFAAAGALADARTDQARKEGEVVWYTAMNVPDTDALRKPFVERYPFLKLTVLRATGEKVRTRILTEARAKRFSWDIVSFNLLDMDALAAEGLLAAYQSAEAATGYGPGAVDPQGRWAAIYVRQYVIGYNTRQVKPDEAPRPEKSPRPETASHVPNRPGENRYCISGRRPAPSSRSRKDAISTAPTASFLRSAAGADRSRRMRF